MDLQEDAGQGQKNDGNEGPAGNPNMPSLRQEVTFQNFKDIWSKITSKEERICLQPALVYQVRLLAGCLSA